VANASNITMIKDVDPMLDKITVQGQCISLWHSHRLNEAHNPYSLDMVLQDSQMSLVLLWRSEMLSMYNLLLAERYEGLLLSRIQNQISLTVHYGITGQTCGMDTPRKEMSLAMLSLFFNLRKYYAGTPSIHNALFGTKMFINRDLPEIQAFRQRFKELHEYDENQFKISVFTPQKPVVTIAKFFHGAVKKMVSSIREFVFYRKDHGSLQVASWYKVIMRIIDQSGSAPIVFFNTMINKLSAYTAWELMERHGMDVDECDAVNDDPEFIKHFKDGFMQDEDFGDDFTTPANKIKVNNFTDDSLNRVLKIPPPSIEMGAFGSGCNGKVGGANDKESTIVFPDNMLIPESDDDVAQIITGGSVGMICAIPRMVISLTDTKMPFKLNRRQFPIQVCFAMTIKKSQGKTLSQVGLFLRRPVFSHGQLYVAVSRVKSKKGLKFFDFLFFASVFGYFVIYPWLIIMGSYRSKEDDVSKISTSIYVTNFPETFSANDLFHSCKVYGHVVDLFIPLKRSKDGKRFGFVRFINVFSVERLVSNLCIIWVDRFKLYANVAHFNRPYMKDHPSFARKGHEVSRGSFNSTNNKAAGDKAYAKTFVNVVKDNSMEKELSSMIVLDDDCLNTKELNTSLLGRVKEFASFSNLKKVGRIAWVEVEGIPFTFWSKNTFNKIATKWGRLLDMDDQDVSSFHSKRLCLRTQLCSNIFESFKVVFRGKVYWVHAKEVLDEVPETDFEETDGLKVGQSDDPFGIYSLNKKKSAAPKDRNDEDQSPKFPPGFTPDMISQEAETNGDQAKSVNGDNPNDKSNDVQ
nr:nucleotide-binding alpha-beta plait domain-containing protein [Tanacetum cinerariifolium]